MHDENDEKDPKHTETPPEEAAPTRTESLPGSRVIPVSGAIDSDMVASVMYGLAALNGASLDPIHVQIHSHGGSLFAGWALYDLFSTNPSPVFTMGFGYVGSAATLAFQGGVARLLGPNATLMIHQANNTLSENMSFSIKEMHTLAEELEELERSTERMLAKRTKQPLAKIRSWCAKETEFTATAAIRYGLADALLRPNKPFTLEKKKSRGSTKR